ncbi:MAG: hypothetical protein KY442_00600 [Proteobacteria bacterium]|nr:hypothetical protein [Pseudomonadota bacterium]
MKKNLALLIATLLLGLAPLALAQNSSPAKRVYCWDDNGRRVCGDALPASAVDSARTEISASSGLTTRAVDRALTPEERAAAAAAAEASAAAAAALATAARRDRAMAESYASEAELRRAFQHRITLLDETVKASQLGIAGLRQSLLSLLRRASDSELGGKPVPKPLTATIQTQHDQLLRQQSLLAEQRRDRGEIEGELELALQRYRELKAPDGADS